MSELGSMQQKLVDLGCWQLNPLETMTAAIVFQHYGNCDKCHLKATCWGLQRRVLAWHVKCIKALSEARMARNWAVRSVKHIDVKRVGIAPQYWP